MAHFLCWVALPNPSVTTLEPHREEMKHFLCWVASPNPSVTTLEPHREEMKHFLCWAAATLLSIAGMDGSVSAGQDKFASAYVSKATQPQMQTQLPPRKPPPQQQQAAHGRHMLVEAVQVHETASLRSSAFRRTHTHAMDHTPPPKAVRGRCAGRGSTVCRQKSTCTDWDPTVAHLLTPLQKHTHPTCSCAWAPCWRRRLGRMVVAHAGPSSCQQSRLDGCGWPSARTSVCTFAFVCACACVCVCVCVRVLVCVCL